MDTAPAVFCKTIVDSDCSGLNWLDHCKHLVSSNDGTGAVVKAESPFARLDIHSRHNIRGNALNGFRNLVDWAVRLSIGSFLARTLLLG